MIPFMKQSYLGKVFLMKNNLICNNSHLCMCVCCIFVCAYAKHKNPTFKIFLIYKLIKFVTKDEREAFVETWIISLASGP